MRPASFEIASGGRRSTTAITVEPDARGADDERQAGSRPASGSTSRVHEPDHLLLVEVDLEDAVDGADEGSHEARVSRPATSAVARRAAAAGGVAGRAGHEVRRREGVAGAGRVDALDRPARGTRSSAPSASTSEPREPSVTSTSGHAERAQRSLVGPAERDARLLLGELEDRDVPQQLGVGVDRGCSGPVRAGLTSPCPSNETRRPRASSASVSGGKSDDASAPTCTQRTPRSPPTSSAVQG